MINYGISAFFAKVLGRDVILRGVYAYHGKTFRPRMIFSILYGKSADAIKF
jgi:hypothetical protein